MREEKPNITLESPKITLFKSPKYSKVFDDSIFDIRYSNHRIVEYRIRDRIGKYSIDRIIEYRISNRGSNSEIFDIRIIESSNHRISNRDRIGKYSIDRIIEYRISNIEFEYSSNYSVSLNHMSSGIFRAE